METTMGSERFDAILIDFYGTIAAGDREAVEAACQRVVQTCEVPVTAERFAVLWGERYFATVEHSNHENFRTLYECEQASLRETLATFGRDVDPAPFLVELEEYWHSPPMHSDALDLLKDLDLPVCCVSNADTLPLASAIARHRLQFDHLVSSQAARCYKPDPQIFLTALDALGVRAERALHVGDSLHSDIRGAAGLGITAVWICRQERVHDIGSHRPDHTIASLAELPALLA
jgi:2-haloacid dehalogenase/putative hydrolase of the HAD superfamily